MISLCPPHRSSKNLSPSAETATVTKRSFSSKDRPFLPLSRPPPPPHSGSCHKAKSMHLTPAFLSQVNSHPRSNKVRKKKKKLHPQGVFLVFSAVQTEPSSSSNTRWRVCVRWGAQISELGGLSEQDVHRKRDLKGKCVPRSGAVRTEGGLFSPSDKSDRGTMEAETDVKEGDV